MPIPGRPIFIINIYDSANEELVDISEKIMMFLILLLTGWFF